MSKQLIIVVSGKKQAGKNTACNFIVAEAFNITDNCNHNYIDKDGYLCTNASYAEAWQKKPIKQVTNQFEEQGIKVYSFADPLKRFCIDVLGAPEESCYGTDDEKNAPIPHLLWENFPEELRPYQKLYIEGNYIEFSGKTSESYNFKKHKEGVMTGRELMQVIGTDFCRKIYGDCWAAGTMKSIQRDGYPLSLVCDGRFPNEMTIGKQYNAKSLRLLRKVFDDNHKSEIALDDFPLSEYDFVVNNQHMTIEDTCNTLKPQVRQWIKESSILES